MPMVIPLPPLPSRSATAAVWPCPQGSARALLLSELAGRHGRMVVAVTADPASARLLEEELPFFAGALPVLHFPDWETLPYDVFNPHPEIVSQRIDTLHRLPTLEAGVLVVPVGALLQRIAPPAHMAEAGFALETGEAFTPAEGRRRLDAAGYRRVTQVADPGDYAARGATLDVFPAGAAQPFRLRIADGAIASIHAVDPETQRSQQTTARLELLPAREFPLSAAAARQFRERLRERFEIDPDNCTLYRDMREGVAPAGIESYLPLFFEHTATLFDYLGDDALWVLDADLDATAEQAWAEAIERHARRADDRTRPVLPPQELYLPPDAWRAQLEQRPRIVLAADAAPDTDIGLVPAPELTLHRKGEPAAGTLKRYLAEHPTRVLIAADSPGRREALADTLTANGLAPEDVADWQGFLALPPTARLALALGPLEQGFALAEPPLALLTERELYGARVRHARRARREARPALGGELAELASGDPVVHAQSGVGRYQGLVAMELGGEHGEFVAIDYAKGDKLYVPVTHLDQVSRYAGTSPEQAPLHALGSDVWTRVRTKAVEQVRDAAAELLALQAQRQARTRTPLPIDRAQLAAFGAAFAFEETPDQQQAIDAVLADLRSPRPMDRVVCGDVGFGKTEVALRAAFAVASAGKQVAVLVPTTLLAQQHYRSFAKRFADWPLRVGVVSRFRSSKKLTDTLERLADGRLDVIIGTHKLLQPDIKFHDLGLVIIDEEQRFGVRQKERLKQLRAEVDVLTMTATPIPRTLSMAMAGLRDLSLIATPPMRRIAVRTTLTPWDPALIREAFRRELARGGQVYFLHNDVQSIERVAGELRALAPEARIAVAHGQMAEGELEKVMADFHRRRANVLVCTTIIETGIDIPSANTIVINRAERFGLAQLQQLRGRVGRSARRAYAYLIVSDPEAVSEDAARRLEAFASVEELGAGFALAAHDLEIRGAGELLGDEQSGQIQAIGFDLYTRLLERTVHTLQAGEEPDLDLTVTEGARIELHLPALIPDDYVPDVPTRLTLYQRIAGAQQDSELRELEVEMIDRFGLLPEPVRQLFAQARLRAMATPLGIAKLDFDASGGAVVYAAGATPEAAAIDALVQSQPQVYAWDGEHTLEVTLDLPEPEDVLRAAEEVLVRLGATRPAR